MNSAYLLIGGNLGDRIENLKRAENAIKEKAGLVRASSAIYETEAWGVREQDAYLNQALELETGLAPKQLLETVLQIEERMGRIRAEKYGPRIIDIDILLYNNEAIKLNGLTIPHPQLEYRRFALQCLDDIAANRIHPLLHKTIHQLLAECTDPLAVNKFY
jgi:2-amino-4-hydroxy-6-hydroxymethyldihydropteridine diphosphokinase